MSELPAPGRFEHLDFNSPLSSARADSLAAALAVGNPQSILDVGCGWGELLIRTVAGSVGATGLGVDRDSTLLARGRANASTQGLSRRIRFVEEDAADMDERADVVICVGADHAYGSQDEALTALYKLVNPGGRLLFGSGFWGTVSNRRGSFFVGVDPRNAQRSERTDRQGDNSWVPSTFDSGGMFRRVVRLRVWIPG